MNNISKFNFTSFKKNFDRFLPFLLCILLAFVIWLYVMYVHAPEYEHEYEDIQVTIKNLPAKFNDYKIQVYETTVTANFKGTNKSLSKCHSSDIKAVLDLSNVSVSGLNNVPVTYEYPSGVSLTCIDNISIWVNLTAPQSRYFTGIPVVVEKDGVRGVDTVGKFRISPFPETVEAYITSTDDNFRLIDSTKIIAVADVSSIDFSAPGTYSSIKLTFVSESGVELNDPNIYIEIIAEEIAAE